jgi:hypothetical protein
MKSQNDAQQSHAPILTAQANTNPVAMPPNSLLILGGLYWGLPGTILSIILLRNMMLKRRALRLQRQINSLERLWQKNLC